MNKVFDGLPVGQLAQQAPQAAPEALASADKANTELVVRFPVDNSVIEGRNTKAPIPIVMENAAYPVMAIINGNQAQSLVKGSANINLTQPGSYQMSLVDAAGQGAMVHFSIR
jgi:hypothetical protein